MLSIDDNKTVNSKIGETIAWLDGSKTKGTIAWLGLREKEEYDSKRQELEAVVYVYLTKVSSQALFRLSSCQFLNHA